MPHSRVSLQILTPRSHPGNLPWSPALGSQTRVLAQGNTPESQHQSLTLGSHPRVLSSNLGQNIQRHFHFLAQFVFTTSETELGYYNHKVNVRVASPLAERLKTQNLRILEISRKSLKCMGLMMSTQPSTQTQTLMSFGKKLQKIRCRKTYLA